MPSTVAELLSAARLNYGGSKPWGTTIPLPKSGIYIVSLSNDPERNVNTHERAPIAMESLSNWIDRVPSMLLDGLRPSVDALLERLSNFWLPDENVIYIGKTDARKGIRGRVGDYYRTPLGDARPHAGGHWIKTLSILTETFVHYSEASEAEAAERTLLQKFVDGVSESTRQRLKDGTHPFPFANLEFPKGTSKDHGIQRPTKR